MKSQAKKLTKEEIGYKTTDKISQMWLLNPHDHHYLFQRDDGSFYGYTHLKKEGEWYWEAHGIQLELFPPPPPKKQEVGTDAPHHNMLEKYYGKDWKPVENKDLADHF